MGEISQEFIFFKKKKRSNENNPTPPRTQSLDLIFCQTTNTERLSNWGGTIIRSALVRVGKAYWATAKIIIPSMSTEFLRKMSSPTFNFGFLLRPSLRPLSAGLPAMDWGRRRCKEETGEPPFFLLLLLFGVAPSSSSSVASKPRGESAQRKKKPGKRKEEGEATLNYRGQQFPLAGFLSFRGSSKVGKWGVGPPFRNLTDRYVGQRRGNTVHSHKKNNSGWEVDVSIFPLNSILNSFYCFPTSIVPSRRKKAHLTFPEWKSCLFFPLIARPPPSSAAR